MVLQKNCETKSPDSRCLKEGFSGTQLACCVPKSHKGNSWFYTVDYFVLFSFVFKFLLKRKDQAFQHSS